jgi:hypothetical protein
VNASERARYHARRAEAFAKLGDADKAQHHATLAAMHRAQAERLAAEARRADSGVALAA